MYSPTLQQTLEHELESITAEGLYIEDRVITTPQGAVIRTATGDEVINFCDNNYLGLSSDPRVIDTAKKTVETHGYGMSSVRFICGTQDIHKELEAKLSEIGRASCRESVERSGGGVECIAKGSDERRIIRRWER